MHQCLGSRKASHPYTEGILDKNYVLRSTSRDTEVLVMTFLPCGRKWGLFGHVVAKSRKAWQTMELYRAWISEVHQTFPGHRKFTWACRGGLGHPISKKNQVKRLFFGWVIPRISFWHHKWLQTDWLTTNWLTNDYKVWLQTDWLQMTTSWLLIDYKWLQVDYKLYYYLIDYKLTTNWLTTNWLIDYKWLQIDWLQMTTNWLTTDD